ncbi:S1C family serine protease [Rubritalea spongiae]|uniref:S1C family serine protease n=1 Tax=Rubritalea spongiae TaxID=430797 RepID=A0ABW5E4B1_9BACT
MRVFSKWTMIIAGMATLGTSHVQAQSIAPMVESIGDIKALQVQVYDVVSKTQPATVALTSDRTGAWGSGVVVNEKGLILTAAHVSQGAETMVVIFPDGKETVAKVLGSNRTKDTGMLQIIEDGSFPFVELGDSDKLVVGDFLVAMGHAGGHDPLRKPPVRFGRMVSRNVGGYFTSDCTLIAGDSGGPIFDLKGELVGINSSIGWDNKANNHAGISALRADWDRLLEGETWGSLTSNPFANSDSPILGVEITRARIGGVLVGSVVPNSPAHEAGVKRGDVITAVNDIAVKDGTQLVLELHRFRPGQEVKLTLIRSGAEMEVVATLMRLADLNQQ